MTPMQWKVIKDFSYYKINNKGEIYSLYSDKILKNKLHPKGYLYIGLHKNKVKYGRKIHRLVAEAFIDNPENKPQVNHKDGNKSNNKVSNLEWSTDQENKDHAINLFGNNHFVSMKGRTGKNSPFHKKLKQFDLNGNLLKIWNGCREMERNLGFKRQGVYHHIKNKTTCAYGYKWEIINA